MRKGSDALAAAVVGGRRGAGRDAEEGMENSKREEGRKEEKKKKENKTCQVSTQVCVLIDGAFAFLASVDREKRGRGEEERESGDGESDVDEPWQPAHTLSPLLHSTPTRKEAARATVRLRSHTHTHTHVLRQKMNSQMGDKHTKPQDTLVRKHKKRTQQQEKRRDETGKKEERTKQGDLLRTLPPRFVAVPCTDGLTGRGLRARERVKSKEARERSGMWGRGEAVERNAGEQRKQKERRRHTHTRRGRGNAHNTARGQSGARGAHTHTCRPRVRAGNEKVRQRQR